MFGYIRPMQGELRVRELERFKACYCGLCHSLGKNYGFASRFILNYELVFLSMLLWGEDEPVKIERKRCIASPCKTKRYCAGSKALDTAAGYSVILTWWKLQDSIADESYFKALPYKIASAFLKYAYRKASKNFSEFDGRARQELELLTRHEKEHGTSIDAAADKFSNILKAAATDDMPESLRRPMVELLYHLGRWVYIMDACDDYADDVKEGRYNPVADIYAPQGGKIPPDGTERLKTTLIHSNNLVSSAFELLPENPWSEIVRNMLYLGMPDACERVLSGRWPPRHKNK